MKRSAFLFGVAVIVLVAVLADLYLWFAATSSNPDFETSKSAYLAHYPAAVQNARMLTVISVILLTLSGYIFLTHYKNDRYKVAALVLALFSAVLLAWKIFSLM